MPVRHGKWRYAIAVSIAMVLGGVMVGGLASAEPISTPGHIGYFAGRSLTQSAEATADYADTAGKRRKENDTVHGTQPGDPARAAAALVEVVGSGKAPELLVLGPDALIRLRSVLDGLGADVDAWEQVSTSTDFPNLDANGQT